MLQNYFGLKASDLNALLQKLFRHAIYRISARFILITWGMLHEKIINQLVEREKGDFLFYIY